MKIIYFFILIFFFQFPEDATRDDPLPEELNDVNIVFTRKMCAVYEIGSEIVCFLSDLNYM